MGDPFRMLVVIAKSDSGESIQPLLCRFLDCFASLAMTA